MASDSTSSANEPAGASFKSDNKAKANDKNTNLMKNGI